MEIRVQDYNKNVVLLIGALQSLIFFLNPEKQNLDRAHPTHSPIQPFLSEEVGGSSVH